MHLVFRISSFKVGADFYFAGYIPISEYNESMARAATTADVFNAIAEPRRREIIDLLVGGGEHAVGDVVAALRVSQPTVSKHLSVLLKVGIVSVSKRGQLRMYRLNAKELKPVYDWAAKYEGYWAHNLDRIKQRAEQKVMERCK